MARLPSGRRQPDHADQGQPLALPNPQDLDGLSAEQLADVATKTAALNARAMANLALLATARQPIGVDVDEQLTAQQVATRMNAKPAWVYRHWRRLGGVKHDGLLRFPLGRLESAMRRAAHFG